LIEGLMRPATTGLLALLLLAGCVSSGPAQPESPIPLTADERRKVDACLREGDQARREGNLDAAEGAYTAALQIHPELAEAYYQRGNVRLQRLRQDALLKDGENAVADYTTTLRLVPTFTKALYNRAVAYYQLAERKWADLYRLAARDLQRLLETNPRDPDAHYFLATIYDKHMEGMETEAVRHYVKYVELGGKKVEAQRRALALAPFMKPEKTGEKKVAPDDGAVPK
jgi:tetratricopeptide (TPR) repeat protein